MKVLLTPKASEVSMGAFYFCMRVNGNCDYGVRGDCNIIGVQHSEVPNGCELVTLFGSDCDVCLKAV